MSALSCEIITTLNKIENDAGVTNDSTTKVEMNWENLENREDLENDEREMEELAIKELIWDWLDEYLDTDGQKLYR